ncbi:MAG: porin [Phycisphaeraceae bacterium]
MKQQHLTNAITPCVAAALLGLTATAHAEDIDVQQELRALRAEVNALRAQSDDTWLSERRAAEVKTLVREVLADADTRASFQGTGLTAGHDGKFFLASEDGNFRLNLGAHLQVRYIWNNRDNSGEDDNVQGFQLRRAKFKGDGHIFDPRLTFAFSLAGDRDDPETVFEDYTLGYEFADGLAVTAGRWKQPFALQEMVSSSRQLATERSVVHEAFNVGRSEGIGLTYTSERLRGYFTINDGIEASFSDFDENTVDVALLGRGELLLAGEWGQFKDPGVAWSGDPTGAMLGGAVYYEVGETGSAADNDNLLRWTADATVESNGFGLLAALYGNHTDNAAGDDFDDFGLLLEGGYFIVPDKIQPFVRYEMITQDDARADVVNGVSSEHTNILTAGVNWYHYKHNAKFTFDVVYALDPINGDFLNPSTGLGLLDDADGEDGQLSVRLQYQVAF